MQTSKRRPEDGAPYLELSKGRQLAAGTQARDAHAHLFASAILHGDGHALNIGQPTALGAHLGVAHIMPELGTLAAHLAFGHDRITSFALDAPARALLVWNNVFGRHIPVIENGNWLFAEHPSSMIPWMGRVCKTHAYQRGY